MKTVGEHVDVTGEEARSGVKGSGGRYVLAVSLFLAVIVLSVVWIIPALMGQGQ